MSVAFKGKEVKVGDVLYLATTQGVSEEKINKLGPKMVEVASDESLSANRYHVENYFSERRNLFWERDDAEVVCKSFELNNILYQIKGSIQNQIYAGKINKESVEEATQKAKEILASIKVGRVRS